MTLRLLLGLLAACQPETKVNPIDDEPAVEEEEGQDTPSEEQTEEETPQVDPSQVDLEDYIPSGAIDHTPDDYIFEEETVEPLLTVEQVKLGIEEGLATVFWADPALLVNEYEGIIETSKGSALAGEGDCPYFYDYYYDDYGYFYWYDSCTADDDVAYAGYALSYDYAGLTSGYYVYNQYNYVSGTGSITSPEGYELELGGYVYDYEYEYAGYYSYHYGYIVGNFAYDDPEFADTWMAADLSINIYVYGDHYDDDESPQNTLTFTGSLAGMTGDVNTIVLTDTYIASASRGSSCELEPSGTISVRDEAGEWYDVTFQGPPYVGASVFPPDCDGCGQVYFRGQELGEVCPDFSILTSWEDRPW